MKDLMSSLVLAAALLLGAWWVSRACYTGLNEHAKRVGIEADARLKVQHRLDLECLYRAWTLSYTSPPTDRQLPKVPKYQPKKANEEQ